MLRSALSAQDGAAEGVLEGGAWAASATIVRWLFEFGGCISSLDRAQQEGTAYLVLVYSGSYIDYSETRSSP